MLTHLQIDLIGHLPPSGEFTYTLMTVYLFLRWVEAFPLRNFTANTTAKILLNEVFPRWGFAITNQLRSELPDYSLKNLIFCSIRGKKIMYK